MCQGQLAKLHNGQAVIVPMPDAILDVWQASAKGFYAGIEFARTVHNDPGGSQGVF
jgi:protocatechuate 3,4-dioxygenase beta subunit